MIEFYLVLLVLLKKLYSSQLASTCGWFYEVLASFISRTQIEEVCSSSLTCVGETTFMLVIVDLKRNCNEAFDPHAIIQAVTKDTGGNPNALFGWVR